MKIVLAAAAAIITFASGALAQDVYAPPPMFFTRKNLPTVRTNPLNGSIGLAGDAIWLQRTRLKTIAARTGAIIRSQDDGAMSWICYTSEAAGARIWLASDSFSDGDLINRFVWAATPGVKPDGGCPAAPKGWTPVLPRGLKLGMSREALKSTLGPASYEHRGILGYVYTRATDLNGVGGVKSVTAWTQVANGKVVLISVGQSSTY